MSKELEIVNCFYKGANHLVHAAFRYYLGRMTAATVDFAESLSIAWDYLENDTQNMIARELEEEFRRDDKARFEAKEWLPLGHNCDRAAWEKVRKKYLP